jgi:transposase InsO family protein
MPISINLWHERMGHMSIQALQRYKDSVKGITLDPSEVDLLPCPGCELGKQMHLFFPGSSKRLEQKLRIIHSDLAGPMQTCSIQGSYYITTFINDYSRHRVVYFLKSKDQYAAVFKKFLAWAENQSSGEHLHTLHSDRRGEYLSSTVQSLLDNKGIEHKLTMPHSPQQNGVAEQWNWTILDKACALLHSTGLPLSFWECAVDTAIHTYNRTPSRTINWHMPHKLWANGHVPDISYFRVFGSKAYVHILEDK